MSIKEENKLVIPNTNQMVQPENSKPLNFSTRELDILACLLDNMKAKKIASLLSISSRTVEVHIRNIIIKLGCSSRKEIPEF